MTRQVPFTLFSIAALALTCCGEPDGTAGPNARETQCPEGFRDLQCEVFLLVNEERAAQGLDPVVFDAALGQAAQAHAEDMSANQYFDHASLDGRSFTDRCVEAGYDARPRGENIAWGQATPEDVMQSWMNSSGHRANILAADTNEIGVGFADQYWVQVFGSRP